MARRKRLKNDKQRGMIRRARGARKSKKVMKNLLQQNKMQE